MHLNNRTYARNRVGTHGLSDQKVEWFLTRQVTNYIFTLPLCHDLKTFVGLTGSSD